MASGGDNWKVQLQTYIDTSNVSAQIKSIAKERIALSAELDLTAFSQGKNQMVNEIAEVGNKIKTILGESTSEALGEANINKFATEYVKSWENATKQVEQDISKIQSSLQEITNFSMKYSGFENFSAQIVDAEVSVEQLKAKLNDMEIHGDITGLENIKGQIKALESDFQTLSQRAQQSLESLNSFSASHAGFDSFKAEINGVEMSVEELKASLSNMQVAGNFTGLEEIRSQIANIKTEFEQVSQIQFNVETGTYSAQMESIVAKTQQWTDVNGQAVISTENLSNAMAQLEAASKAYEADNSVANMQQLITAQENYSRALTETKNKVTEYNAEWAKTSQVQALLQRITEWTDKNSAAMGKWGAETKSMMAELSSGVQMPVSRLKELEAEFKQVGNAAREAGQLGQSFGDKITSAMSKFSYWTSATMIVMQSIQAIREAITTVVDLDTALVDLQKTTTMTTDELESFYYEANGVAQQMGVTTEEIINQAAAWSRLGYSSQEAATTMAALSSQFASISPGMDTETAQEGLVSVMKAFEIDVDDVLDGIMSKINIVGNTAATTNADIVEMLERSSSAMVEANNTLDETIALSFQRTIGIIHNPIVQIVSDIRRTSRGGQRLGRICYTFAYND